MLPFFILWTYITKRGVNFRDGLTPAQVLLLTDKRWTISLRVFGVLPFPLCLSKYVVYVRSTGGQARQTQKTYGPPDLKKMWKKPQWEVLHAEV